MANDLRDEFIFIPAWNVEGLVIDQEPTQYGHDDAIRVLVMEHPDDEHPRWYHLEPGEYTIL